MRMIKIIKDSWLALSVIGIGGVMMLGKAWRKMT